MLWLCERVVETALLLILVASGTILLHAAVFTEATASDADGCYNDTCHGISYWYQCNTRIGNAQRLQSCLPCGAPSRCDSGDSGGLLKCSIDTKQKNGIAVTSVDQVCYCANAPANADVEASSNYVGPYNDSGVNQWTCARAS